MSFKYNYIYIYMANVNIDIKPISSKIAINCRINE